MLSKRETEILSLALLSNRQIERRDLINENRESRMKLYDAIVK